MNNQAINRSPVGSGTTSPTNDPVQPKSSDADTHIRPFREATSADTIYEDKLYKWYKKNPRQEQPTQSRTHNTDISKFGPSQQQREQPSSTEPPIVHRPPINESILSFLLGKPNDNTVNAEINLPTTNTQTLEQQSNVLPSTAETMPLENLSVAGWCYTRKEIETLLEMPTKPSTDKNLPSYLEALGSRIRDSDEHILKILMLYNFADEGALKKFAKWAKEDPIASNWHIKYSNENLFLGNYPISYEEFETLRKILKNTKNTKKLYNLKEICTIQNIRNIIGYIVAGNEKVWQELVEKGFSTFQELCAIRNWGKTYLNVQNIGSLHKGKYYDANPAKSAPVIGLEHGNFTTQLRASFSDVALKECPDPVHRDFALDNDIWYRDSLRNVMKTVYSHDPIAPAPLSTHFLVSAEKKHARKLMDGGENFITGIHKLGFVSAAELKDFYNWATKNLKFNSDPYKAPPLVYEIVEQLALSEPIPDIVTDPKIIADELWPS